MWGNDPLPNQSTAFIGRQREIAEIAALIAEPKCRLLTLVGPGGIGKTRLAMEAVQQVQTAFAEGALFVPLAPISDVANIPTTIAGTFKIHLDANTDAAAQLLNYLRDKTLLLILDNFEHLLDGAKLVADILRTAPGVRILATSREPLNLQDEWLWQVKGLPFPDDEHIAQFGDYEAVQLFAERARRVRHDFEITREANHVIRICGLVEGMPLAVELAAGWLKTLTCKQIGEQIQRNLDILVSPARDAPTRHRSIRAVFDHSWNSLTEEQQAVFRRLSVFRGGFTLEAAEKVAGASLWMLAGLVDKSMLHVEDGRYNIHELLRQYGEEKLVAAGEVDSTQDAHSAYFLEFMAERLPDVKGRRQREAALEIDADFENIRVAWLRGVDRKDVQGLDAALETLDIYYGNLRVQYALVYGQLLGYAFNRFDEDREDRALYRIHRRLKARQWNAPFHVVEDCLQAAREANDLIEIALRLEHLANFLYFQRVEFAQVLVPFNEAMEMFRALPDPYYLARALFSVSLFSVYCGYVDKANSPAQESYEIRQEINDKHGEAWSVGWLALLTDDDAEHERGLEKSFQLFEHIGSYEGVSIVRFYQGADLVYRGEFSEAQSCAEEGLHLAQKCNYNMAGGANFITLALLACIEGDYEQGKQFCHKCRTTTGGNRNLDFDFLAVEAFTHFGLGEYEAAEQDQRAALAGFLSRGQMRNIVGSLPVSALLAAYNGQAIWACEILARAFSYPKTRTGWLHKWDLMAELRSDLERKLGAEAFTAAWERGAKLDLEEAVRRILAQEPSPPTPQSEGRKTLKASQIHLALPEALSKRELEILHLIADGLQNQEIADQLFIAVGTVKTHINAIFHKLDAANRTQAVTRARELGLLP